MQQKFTSIPITLLASIYLNACGPSASLSQPSMVEGEANAASNPVLMQYFHWYSPADGSLWRQLANEASALSSVGITALWLPPAFKGFGGANDVGYGVYDLYDLGEFNQKGSVRTKYGTKDEYLAGIEAAHRANMAVYADVVVNHRIGSDFAEEAVVVAVQGANRLLEVGAPFRARTYTGFNFPGRQGKYSRFSWNARHFDGVDSLASDNGRKGIFRMSGAGKSWDQEVSTELGNYDYLIGADLDFDQSEVTKELEQWGTWFLDFARVDGFRLDAVKHIKGSFFDQWLQQMRQASGRSLFTVGEYWDYDSAILLRYLRERNANDGSLWLFDAPLHLNFFKAGSADGSYDMSQIFANTLIEAYPSRAVTLVENHDTQALQALASPVEDWFKPLAYALILLRAEGLPSIFYPDYYGATYNDRSGSGKPVTIVMPSFKETLDRLLKARHAYAYGPEKSYLDAPDIIGWTREGDASHPEGLAVLMSDGPGGSKRMSVGRHHAGQCFRDIMGRIPACVVINAKGEGLFKTEGRQVAVWVGDATPP